MKNSKQKFNIICHIDDMSFISRQISVIHADKVVSHIGNMNISNEDKQKLIKEIIEFEQ